jgi:hypothetical protein
MVEAASKRGLSTTVGPVPIVRAAPASPAFLTFAATSRGMVDVNGFPDDLGRHTPSLTHGPTRLACARRLFVPDSRP